MVFVWKQRMKDLQCYGPRIWNILTSSFGRLRHNDYTEKRRCRTCSTVIFPHSTNQINDLRRCLCHCSHHFSNSLLRVGRRQLLNRQVPFAIIYPCTKCIQNSIAGEIMNNSFGGRGDTFGHNLQSELPCNGFQPDSNEGLTLETSAF